MRFIVGCLVIFGAVVILRYDICKIYYRWSAGQVVSAPDDNVAVQIHFSLDDVIDIFQDLTVNQERYSSIFDQPILAYLRELHDCYGIKISLYCFYQSEKGFRLSDMTDRYAEEFRENAEWLKFGFHGWDCNKLYNETPDGELETDYPMVIQELIRITGGDEALTRCIRLSSFQATQESVHNLTRIEHGITGLMTADDNRGSYNLPQNTEDIICMKGCLTKDCIDYYHTDIRIEYSPDISEFENAIKKKNICVIFTHEYYIMSRKMQRRIERILLEIKKRGYGYSFLE